MMRTGKRVVKAYLAAMVLVSVCVSDVNAEVIEIAAQFKAPTLTPNNVFIDTTTGRNCTLSTLCTNGRPLLQTLIGVEVSSSNGESLIPTGTVFEISIPTEYKNVQLIHESGSHTAEAQFKLTGLGGTLFSDLTGRSFTGQIVYNNINSGWFNSPTFSALPPCSGPETVPGVRAVSSIFLWRYNTSSTCGRTSARQLQTFKISNLALQYDLKMPTPFSMRAGTYKGTLRYSVGANTGRSDINFVAGSNLVKVTDTVLTINFTLTVDTIFRVEAPPGANKIELAPQEGWQRWFFHGKAPTRLIKHQTFNVWSNSRFNVRLECAARIGNDCAIQTVAGPAHAVPIQVSMSLPDSYRDLSNQKITRRLIKVGGDTNNPIAPVAYVGKTPGDLFFEIKEASVVEMLKYPDSRYSGTLTVVWDSFI